MATTTTEKGQMFRLEKFTLVWGWRFWMNVKKISKKFIFLIEKVQDKNVLWGPYTFQ